MTHFPPLSLIDRIRSLVFTAVFYLGTAYFVIGAIAGFAVSRRVMRYFVKGWCRYQRWCARAILGLKLDIEGAPAAEPVLYAIKHESFFEAIDLPWLLTDPVVIAKQELLDLPFWGFAAKRYGMIGVSRDQGASALRAMMKQARAYAAEGRPLAIFPEGTRVPHGQAPALQSGFAGLYKMLGMTVIPVAVNSGPYYRSFWKRGGTIRYVFGEPIPPGLPRAEVEERVRAAINALNAKV